MGIDFSDMPDQGPNFSDLPDQAPTSTWDKIKSAVKTGWADLKKPEDLSRQGLNELADAVPTAEPTGNPVRDLALNAPSILAKSVAEVAPDFVSRGALVTGAAGKAVEAAAPLINSAGGWVGNAAEAMSGLKYKTPGVLAEAVENPKLILGQGIEKARETYNAASDVPFNNVYGVPWQGSGLREALQQPLSKSDFVEQALQFAKDGTLNPDEALEARKSLDAIKNQLSSSGYYQTRQIFDGLAKQKYGEADEAYEEAVKSEALRNIWPINKSGSPSIVKGAVTTAIPVTAPLFSPAVQGLAASGVGLAKNLVNALGTEGAAAVQGINQGIGRYLNPQAVQQ